MISKSSHWRNWNQKTFDVVESSTATGQILAPGLGGALYKPAWTQPLYHSLTWASLQKTWGIAPLSPCLFIYLQYPPMPFHLFIPAFILPLTFPSNTSTTQKHLQLIFSLRIPTANCKNKLHFFYPNSVAVVIMYMVVCISPCGCSHCFPVKGFLGSKGWGCCPAEHTQQNEKSNAKQTYCWG